MLQQVVASDLKVAGHVVEYARKRSDSEALMARNGHMVLAACGCCQPDVRTFLSCWLIAELPQYTDEFVCRKITRQLHGWSISSRTMCKRMIFGTCPSSKWHATASRIPSRNSGSVSASVKIDSPSARAV